MRALIPFFTGFFLVMGIFSVTKLHAETTPAAAPAPQYAIALHGTPKYPEGFTHFDFVNPDAPKGGTLRRAETESFDSLNPFIIKGTPAVGLNYFATGLVYESLMQNSYDEPFTMYGILASHVTVADDKSWVKFDLRPEAKWADGKPVTADDVIWTFETLTTKGQPFFKAYWNDVESITPEGEHGILFKFSVKGNAELPLIIGQMAILPKHYWTDGKHNFEETSLEPPLGSGAYKVGKVEAGRSIEYVRNENWWGKDLPFFKGMHNFDRITYDYYRSEDVEHESYLAGNFDVKEETQQKRWEEDYDVPALKEGKLKKEEIEHSNPAGMTAFLYNIRRPIFQNIKVREALAYGLDFEWSNKTAAYGKYIRTNSYFENSELASFGLPSPEELKILEPFRDKIPAEVFTKEYNPPATDGSGNIRANLRSAITLLEAAGYDKLDKNGIRYKVTDKGEEKLSFEILYFSPIYERWIIPFTQNLKKMGVEAKFRVVDPAQFQNRLNEFDYDMSIGAIGQSESPGNEQREFWGSDKADIKGSRNYIGIKDPVIDDIVTQLIHAESREDLITKTRALDRILLWNHYVIPMWHFPKWRISYWETLKRPEKLSDSNPLIAYTWWSAAAEAAQKKESETKP